MKYNKIREFIAGGNISEAIELLMKEVENSNIKERNEILLQSLRLNSVLKEKRVGIVSYDEANLVVNQVTNGILSLLEDLENKYPTNRLVEQGQSQPEKRNITFELVNADVSNYPSDVLILKYAQNFYGADKSISKTLVETNNIDITELTPEIGKYRIINSNGAIESKHVLFVGVEELWNFRYSEISNFTEKALKLISKHLKAARNVAFTIHGVGYGLDEIEAFQSQLGGLKNAIEEGNINQNLEKILIIERDKDRFLRLTDNMSKVANLLGLKQINSKSWNYSFYDVNSKSTYTNDHLSHHQQKREEVIIDKPFVFVAMPFKKEFDDVFYFGIQGAVHENNLLCERIDQEVFTGDVLNRILTRIEKAKFVIAELSGANPNVYLEIGYAWGKNKPTILLTKDTKDIQFDLRGQKCLSYERIIDLKEKLSIELKGVNNS